MSGTSDIYLQPGDLGFVHLAEFDRAPRHYDFDIILVLQDLSDDSIWVIKDTGHSGYSPFDYIKTGNDVYRNGVEVENFQYLDRLLTPASYSEQSFKDEFQAKKTEFLSKASLEGIV